MCFFNVRASGSKFLGLNNGSEVLGANDDEQWWVIVGYTYSLINCLSCFLLPQSNQARLTRLRGLSERHLVVVKEQNVQRASKSLL